MSDSLIIFLYKIFVLNCLILLVDSNFLSKDIKINLKHKKDINYGNKIYTANHQNVILEYPQSIHYNLSNDFDSKQFDIIKRSRIKRQSKKELHRGQRYLEVMLAVTDSVVKFHGKKIIEQYLLTLMNIVDDIYHHPTLGIEINIIVTKIIYLNESISNKILTKRDGHKTLHKFCVWSKDLKNSMLNAKGSNGKTFDIAVYLTRDDIGPAGFAPVTGMCDEIRSCAIVRDDGMTSALIIAHEIGHVFGMNHDDLSKQCPILSNQDGKIMASMVVANFDSYYWSQCSREAMNTYLPDSYCLDNKPDDPGWPKYNQPFGQNWSLDEQCRQEFGIDYGVCSQLEDYEQCAILWCTLKKNITSGQPTICKTKKGPPLTGTLCGNKKWCMNGICTERKSVSVDGVWSEWEPWNRCSRTCGVGFQSRIRICNNPRPSNGGRQCKGESQEVQVCNKKECYSEKDPRAIQCSEYDEKKFIDNRRTNWLPFENKNATAICKLTCISRYGESIFVSNEPVLDGTLCSYDDQHSRCFKGVCLKIGCDSVINSRMKEDTCGECNGNNRNCKKIKGSLNEIIPHKEYIRIIGLPVGARSIVIKERQSKPHLSHFFAIRDSATETWYLNDNTIEGASKSFVIHGASFTYSNGKSEGESINSKGPLLKPVDILIYSMSSKLPAYIEYEYTIHSRFTSGFILTKEDIKELQSRAVTDHIEEEERYIWALGNWSDCTKTCGSGVQYEMFICIDQIKMRNADGLCNQQKKPKVDKQPCNIKPCPTSSTISTTRRITSTSKTRYPPTSATTRRTTNKKTTTSTSRKLTTRTTTTKLPIKKSNLTYWYDYQEWENIKCSQSCGKTGFQTRHVQCITNRRGRLEVVDPRYCIRSAVPSQIQVCNRFPCHQLSTMLSTTHKSTELLSLTAMVATPLISKLMTMQKSTNITLQSTSTTQNPTSITLKLTSIIQKPTITTILSTTTTEPITTLSIITTSLPNSLNTFNTSKSMLTVANKVIQSDTILSVISKKEVIIPKTIFGEKTSSINTKINQTNTTSVITPLKVVNNSKKIGEEEIATIDLKSLISKSNEFGSAERPAEFTIIIPEDLDLYSISDNPDYEMQFNDLEYKKNSQLLDILQENVTLV